MGMTQARSSLTCPPRYDEDGVPVWSKPLVQA